jgi:hypothetical protein
LKHFDEQGRIREDKQEQGQKESSRSHITSIEHIRSATVISNLHFSFALFSISFLQHRHESGNRQENIHLRTVTLQLFFDIFFFFPDCASPLSVSRKTGLRFVWNRARLALAACILTTPSIHPSLSLHCNSFLGSLRRRFRKPASSITPKLREGKKYQNLLKKKEKEKKRQATELTHHTTTCQLTHITTYLTRTTYLP